MALGPWCPPSMGRRGPWVQGVDGHTHVAAEDGASQEVWGAGVWWAQGQEGREVGEQFRSSTIWAANASVWHAATGEAPHTWLHCVRSRGQGGWGRDWCPAVPWGLCCHTRPGPVPGLWAEVRGSRWPISCPFLVPCPRLWDKDKPCHGEVSRAFVPAAGGEVAWFPLDDGTEAGTCLPVSSWRLLVLSGDGHL